MKDREKFIREASHYLDELYNFSLVMTGSHKHAEKLLTRIVADAADFYKYHQPENIKIWLTRIAINLYEKHFKENSTDISDQIDSAFTSLAPDAVNFAVEEFFREAEEKDIMKLMHSLPPDLRIALTLKEVLNFNYDLITELLDIPEGTVIMRITRARSHIYTYIKERSNG
jgi:RNA polymerase sigma-70 factor, ECF subfamily